MRIKVYKYPLKRKTKLRNIGQNLVMLSIGIVTAGILFYGAEWVFNLNDKEDLIIKNHIERLNK